MTDTRFTDEQVMSTLHTVVAENPDFVYEAPDELYGKCVYVHDGAPSCLVGHVMARLGFPLGEFGKLEGASPDQIVDVLGISARAADVLTEAQDYQDQGNTWSYALARAEKYWEG